MKSTVHCTREGRFHDPSHRKRVRWKFRSPPSVRSRSSQYHNKTWGWHSQGYVPPKCLHLLVEPQNRAGWGGLGWGRVGWWGGGVGVPACVPSCPVLSLHPCCLACYLLPAWPAACYFFHSNTYKRSCHNPVCAVIALPPAACYLLPATCCLLLAACAACCLLLAACCLLPLFDV